MFENNWISNTDRAKQLDSQLDERFTNSWAHFLPSFGIQRTINVCFSQAFLSGSSVVKDSTEKNPLIPSWSITRIKAVKGGIKKWNLLPLQSSWPWEILTECYVVNLFKMVLMWWFSVFKCVTQYHSYNNLKCKVNKSKHTWKVCFIFSFSNYWVKCLVQIKSVPNPFKFTTNISDSHASQDPCMQDIKSFLTTVDFIVEDDGIGPFSKTGEKKKDRAQRCSLSIEKEV